jgi:soluble lytic murein transglycosylase
LNTLLCIVSIFFAALLGSNPEGEVAHVRVTVNSLARRGPSTQQAVDSAEAELARGRAWHAARILREGGVGEASGPQEVLLLAEAEGGWGNWAEVVRLLRDPEVVGLDEEARSWFLLGRAWEEDETWREARQAYSRFLPLAEQDSPEVLEAHIRRALLRARTGEYPEARSEVLSLLDGEPLVSSWLALELATITAAEGLPVETERLLSLIPQRHVRERGWELGAQAFLAGGDTATAEALYWRAIPSLQRRGDQATAWDLVARLRLARGDSIGARGAYHQVLRLGVRGSASVRAAGALIPLGFDSASVALRGAEALGAAGQARDALRAYATYEALLGATPSDEVALAKARLHLSLRERRAAVTILQRLARSEDSSISVPSLALLAEALAGLGRRNEARAAEDRLVAEYPQTPEAVDVLFFRADALERSGALDRALEAYEAASLPAPSLSRAGQSRMRKGQLLLRLGREADAASEFSTYLEDFPGGRRWEEAAFWAGRTLLTLGREEEASGLLERVVRGSPFSYYAVQSCLLLEVPYAPSIESPADSLPFPVYVREGLRRLELLRASGLDAAVRTEVARLIEASRISQEDMLRLALELNDRGFTREGINLGWELRRSGRGWDLDLVRAIYPFPYRRMVQAEASEWGVDPFFMAGLMRQESAFWAEARSRADARGLMQVLPSTGRELARSVGPAGFQAERDLYNPEVNLHLGMAFFSDLRRRFGDEPTLLLSAYNAGPTRARRWRNFPEAGDPVRFTERIPFSETRGYVKNVLLNRALYGWLYGGQARVETEPVSLAWLSADGSLGPSPFRSPNGHREGAFR